MKTPILIALASALITAAGIKAAPALAQEAAPGEVQVSLVRTADLDLGSKEGQRRLQQRLANAARKVCGTASDADLEGKNAVRQCRDEAIAKALQSPQAVAASRRDETIAVTATR